MDELISRQLPHSVEAEQAVLGSMLIDSRCVPDVVERLKPDDFYMRQNREIYEVLYAMFSRFETIDPVTLLDRMKQAGIYDENTSVAYLRQLMEITPTAANVLEYADIVRDKALLRRVGETAGELTEMVRTEAGTAQQVLEAAEQGARPRRPARRLTLRLAALSACCVLAVAGGRLLWLGGSAPIPNPTAGMAATPAPAASSPAWEHTLTVGPGPFAEGEAHNFFDIPALNFPDCTDFSPRLTDRDWGVSSFEEKLTAQEIITALGGHGGGSLVPAVGGLWTGTAKFFTTRREMYCRW